MPGRSDEIQENVHTVISEPGVSLDSRLFREDIIILAFEVSDDFGKAALRSVLNGM